MDRDGPFLSVERDRLPGLPQDADRRREGREALEQLGMTLGGGDRKQRHVADFRCESPQAAHRNERGDGQPRALHVLRNSSGQSVSATEVETTDQTRSFDFTGGPQTQDQSLEWGWEGGPVWQPCAIALSVPDEPCFPLGARNLPA